MSQLCHNFSVCHEKAMKNGSATNQLRVTLKNIKKAKKTGFCHVSGNPAISWSWLLIEIIMSKCVFHRVSACSWRVRFNCDTNPFFSYIEPTVYTPQSRIRWQANLTSDSSLQMCFATRYLWHGQNNGSEHWTSTYLACWSPDHWQTLVHQIHPPEDQIAKVDDAIPFGCCR